MKKLFCILSVIIFCFLDSCKKDTSGYAIDHSYHLPQAVKDYTYFKEGTYWVYRDSVSGAEDSVYVYHDVDVKVRMEAGNVNGLPEGEYEGIESDAISSYDNSTLSSYMNTTYCFYCIDSNLTRPCYYVERSRSRPFDYMGSGYFFFYNLRLHYYVYNDSFDKSKIELTATNTTLVTDAFTFNNVQKFYTSKNIIEKGNNTNYYLAPNIGIVRKELLDSNQVWNLVRYKIIQ
jgi:hypothetical protein